MFLYYPLLIFVGPTPQLDPNVQDRSFIPQLQQRSRTTEAVDQLAYEDLLKQELKQHRIKKAKKNWTKCQDQILRSLRKQRKQWEQISKLLQFSTPEKCRRRYERLTAQEKKWPKEIDDLIISLYDKKGQDWVGIAETINQYGQAKKFNSKQLRQRYHFFLKEGISNQEWSIADDIHLLREQKRVGNSWKQIAANFKNRTELQVKNRFYGTLKFIQQRVNKKIKERYPQIQTLTIQQ